MFSNAINFLFIQHSQETLITSIAFYLSILALINLETIAAAAKHATKSCTII